MNWYAVINGKISPKKKKVVNQILESYKIRSCTTTSPGQASELLNKGKDYDGIISVGGDGTFHEVINGSNLDRQKILVVPGGTINCFSRFLKIRKPEQGIKLVKEGALQKLDLLSLKVNYKDGASEKRIVWGFLTLGRLVRITALATKLKRLPKFFRYPVSTVINHVICRRTSVNISVNGKPAKTRKFSSFILNNATASHFSSIPAWDMQDGVAELQIVNHNLVIQFLASFSRFIKFPINFSWITGIRSVRCEFDQPVKMMADGELLSDIVNFELAVLEKSCEMLLPAGVEMKYKIPGFTGKWKELN